MKSLYFNTKLIGSQLHSGAANNFSFYPLMYPRSSEGLSQLDVLIGVIESFRVITFKNAIFNVEVDNISQKQKKRLLSAIDNNINVLNDVYINLHRPSSRSGWIEDVSYYIDKTQDSSPFMVVMNHDHPYIDYSEQALDRFLNEVFQKKVGDFKRVAYYSHTPEVISKCINNISTQKLQDRPTPIYQHRKIDYWIDSICFMSLETLRHIFESARVKDDFYLGRFDWEGVVYSRLDLTGYSCSREFCRHYDGYSHVTGIRAGAELTIPPFAETFPNFTGNLDDVTDFYYNKWKAIYILAVRDYIKARTFRRKKQVFVEVLELTMLDFFRSYIESDAVDGLISEDDVEKIKYLVRSKVYYFANSMYCEILVDIQLSHVPLWKKVASLIPYNYKVRIKSARKLFF